MVNKSWVFNVSNELYPMQVKRILDRKAFYEGVYNYSGVEAEGQHKPIL
jgi:hypothetical protein